jgi:hypothetical protein
MAQFGGIAEISEELLCVVEFPSVELGFDGKQPRVIERPIPHRNGSNHSRTP